MDILTLKRANVYTDKKELEKYNIPVSTPLGFSWTDHPLDGNIYTDGNGNFTVKDFDVADYQITGKTYYVDVVNGSDSNDGLTLDTAFKRIITAFQQGDAQVIKVAEGLYHKVNAFNGAETPSVSIKAISGKVRITNAYELTWSLSSGKSNTYEATLAYSVGNVFDAEVQDNYGDYTELTEVATIPDVETTQGSYYYDDYYDILYVHTANSRPADVDVMAYGTSKNVWHYGAGDVYLEGIEFEGGAYSVQMFEDGATPPGNLYAKNCSFKYSAGNAINVQGTPLTIMQNCIAAYSNTADGFNYHAYNGIIPKVIEINCIGRNNGDSDSDNGSTIHDGGSIIRINGSYYGNYGPNIADVNSGTESWNIRVSSFESQRTTPTDYTFTDTAETWLDSCLAFGSTQSLELLTSAIANVRNCSFDQTEDISGGTKNNY